MSPDARPVRHRPPALDDVTPAAHSCSAYSIRYQHARLSPDLEQVRAREGAPMTHDCDKPDSLRVTAAPRLPPRRSEHLNSLHSTHTPLIAAGGEHMTPETRPCPHALERTAAAVAFATFVVPSAATAYAGQGLLEYARN